MYYISKGMGYKKSAINVDVSRCGNEYNLVGSQAKLWLAGQFHAKYIKGNKKLSELRELESIGLVEITEPDNAAHYRLLTNCVICSVTPENARFPLNKNEKRVWAWIKNAGFKLTISEIVYLTEKNIIPGPEYFGEDNWHILIHSIYTQETIFDRILEARMEESHAKNNTVSAVLGLLRKNRIILI